MKAKDLRQMSATEWDQKLSGLMRELYDLRSRARTGKLEKPSQVSRIRKDIARILTLKREVRKNGK
ncbi:MAG: 50S ribosomal protein L29 [Candidatus Omnitrophica bacterium]|nr:50S ribosomal protein L29 [Candidatus Omnitrophota bacterium]